MILSTINLIIPYMNVWIWYKKIIKPRKELNCLIPEKNMCLER